MKTSLRYALIVALGLGLGVSSGARAADYTARAEGLLAKGQTRAAMIELRNAIKHDPRDGAAHYELAKLALMLGDAVTAEREARAAKAQGYAPGESLSLLMDTYLAQARYGDLLRDFPRGTGTPDIEARTAVGRGQAEMALGRLDRAGADFAAAVRLAPHAVYPLLASEGLYAREGNLDKAEAAITAALAIDPQSRPALSRKAALLLARGNPKGAIAILEPLRAKTPGDPQVRFALANALIAAGEDAKAAAEVKAALGIVPGAAEGIYLQAVLAAHAGEYREADVFLQKLSPVIAHFPQAYLLQALTKGRLGQWAEAEDAIRHYLARFPSDTRAEALLADIALHTNHPHEALAALGKLPVDQRKNPATLGLLGRAHVAAGDYAAAMQEFTEAATLAPDLVEPRVELATLKLHLGDLRGAIEEYRMAVRIGPNDAGVRRSLVAAEIEGGQYEAAAANLAILKKQEKGGVANDLLQGQLELAMLDLQKARATYGSILRAHPHLGAAALGAARAEILDGKSKEAKRRLDAMLAKNPADGGALGLLTALLATEGEQSEILGALQRAHGAAPNDPGVIAQLAALEIRAKQAGKALDLLTTSGVASRPMMLNLKAQAEIALGQDEAAQTTLRMVLARLPNDAGVRVALAQLLSKKKDFIGARAVLQDGLARAPRNLALLQALVGVAAAEHGPAKAIAEAKDLAADPAHQPEASVLEGDAYMGQHDPEAAARAYTAASAENPSEALVLRLVAALRASGKSTAANEELSRYVAAHPASTSAMLALASVEIEAGHLTNAAAWLEKIVAAQPNNVVALNDLAWIRGEQGHADALRLAERAYFLSGDAHIADTLGWILSRHQANRTGVVLLRQAHAAIPDDPAISYHLAVALAGVGANAEALALLRPLAARQVAFKEQAAARQLLEKLGGHS